MREHGADPEEASAPGARERLVAGLAEVARGDVAQAGGKGANLGELTRAGFPVPAGFVVTTLAYRRFVEQNHLSQVIDQELGSGSGAAIREAFERSPIPSDVAAAVADAYRRLGGGPVAVRSSATAEDLEEAAFAGQQETYLGISGGDELLQAVRNCWASLWTDRAIAYRRRLGFDRSPVELAVVVQRMVPAATAGVMFTANPVTGERPETVIDASPGLGEAVVSGLVTPDHFALRPRIFPPGWRIVEFSPGKREVIIRSGRESGTQRERGEVSQEARPSLSGAELNRLADIGRRIAEHYRAPQDIEWAIANGELWIVQARPLTALPEAGRRPGRKALTFAAIVAEMVPGRPYPLEESTWGFERGFTALLGPVLRLMGLEPHPEYVFEKRGGVVVRLSGRLPVRLTLRVLLAPLRLVRTGRRYDASHWKADPLLATLVSQARQLESCEVEALSWSELLGQITLGVEVAGLAGELRCRYLAPRFLEIGLLRLLVLLLGEGASFGTLLFTGQETRTIEANRRLAHLAALARSQPRLVEHFRHYSGPRLWERLQHEPAAAGFLEEFLRFLAEYGHRETGGTLQLSQPTWKEKPEVVLDIIKGLASEELDEGLEQNDWVVVRDRLLAHQLLRPAPLRKAFLHLLTGARRFPLIREDTRFYGTMVLPVLRKTVNEMARRLVQAGVLDDPHDIFHLEFGELAALSEHPPTDRQRKELRERVATRQAARSALESVPLVPPRFFERRDPGGGKGALVRGTPGSPGQAEGTVRVIASSTEFGTLLDGEILVAPFTNPAWTPLFARAKAVVVDTGGATSHAAIIAREYRIPAVMATGDGTRKLVTGMRVRVDGGAGAVYALESAAPAATPPVRDADRP